MVVLIDVFEYFKRLSVRVNRNSNFMYLTFLSLHISTLSFITAQNLLSLHKVVITAPQD